jgi:ABC-type glycerol-3-phosphate transport system substrate-binding protein
MIRRPSSCLAGLLACGLLAAGCGSSGATKSASTAATSTSTPTASTPSSATVARAVAACKTEIQTQSTLPASAKSKLESVCSKAAKGEKRAVTAVAREVCEEVIKRASLAKGSAEEQALASCRTK